MDKMLSLTIMLLILAGFLVKSCSDSAPVLAPDGSQYQGDLKDGLMHGQGVLIWPDGSRYEGGFREGRLHGEGEVFLSDPQFGISSYAGVWEEGVMLENDLPGPEIRYEEADVEALLYTENGRLRRLIQSVPPGREGEPEVYLLAIAGDGQERVFRREVSEVAAQLKTRYGDRLHSSLLINAYDELGTYPMATVTSIEQVLHAIGRQMNREEDLLMLYISSHGSEDHQISLAQVGLSLPDLPAQKLAVVLEESGIRYRFIMVSACYSGGFIGPLADPDSIVLTAAAHDRTSFGCSDDSDMTYFGKALFREVFNTSDSWPSLFRQATEVITAWETAEALTPSLPQAHFGEQVLKKMDRYRSAPAILPASTPNRELHSDPKG